MTMVRSTGMAQHYHQSERLSNCEIMRRLSQTNAEQLKLAAVIYSTKLFVVQFSWEIIQLLHSDRIQVPRYILNPKFHFVNGKLHSASFCEISIVGRAVGTKMRNSPKTEIPEMREFSLLEGQIRPLILKDSLFL